MSLPRDIRARLLTLLLLLVAGAGVFVWARREDLLSRPLPQTGPLYPGLHPNAVTWLHLGLRGGQHIELERESSGPWWITQPTREFARQERVAVVLDNLARAQVDKLEATAGPLTSRDVGLEPPERMIAFGAGSQRETLSLGAVEPLGKQVYARRSGDDNIVLATRNLVTLLEDNPSEWVDPALLRGVLGAVTGLDVDGPGGRMQAERAGGAWSLRTPEPVLADGDRLDQLVRTLQFARVAHVLAPAPGATTLHDLGLPTQAEAMRGETRGATRLALRAGGAEAVAWLAAGWQTAMEDVPTVRDDFAKIVSIPRGSLNLLANPPDWFREHHLLPPVRERIESLRLERGQEVVLDIRRGTGGLWTFSAPAHLKGQAVESERVAGYSTLGDFLGRIDAFEARGFGAPPAAPPVARLVAGWTQAGRMREDRVDLHEADGRILGVTSERPTEALELPPGILELFAPVTPELLRSLRPLGVDFGQCAHLVLERLGGETLEIRRDPATGNWTGDDEWTRRAAWGNDLARGLRGFRWQPARAGAHWLWRVQFENAEGAVLAELRLRLPEPDEPAEVLGFPCAVAAFTGRDGVELVLHREWVDRLEDLAGPLVRKP